MSKPKIIQFIETLEARIPPSCSEAWDQVGLICGNASQALNGITIGVDLTESLLQLAIREKSNLIVIHHPPLFPKGKGLGKLIVGENNELPTLLLKCFQQNICVYVAHTNFDRCGLDGMVALAYDLGGEPFARVWEPADEGKSHFKKLVTYIPVDYFESVRDALYMMGVGHIGNYDCCGFGVAGMGNYRPLQGASPFFGKTGVLEEAEEIRLETIFVDGMQEQVLATLRSAHPYEEVAYDLYSVEQAPSQKGLVWGFGYGFVAELKKPIRFEAFIKKVKTVFKVKQLISNQVTPKVIKKIAFSPGKGTAFVNSAKAHHADVFITGEVGYHASLDSARKGLSVIELGHRESELYFLKTFHLWCKEWQLPHHVLDERTQRIL